MTLKKLDPSQRKTVRVAGLLYLLGGLPGAFSMMYVHKTLVVAGDAAATADKVLGAEMLFRAGIVAELVSAVSFIFLVRALYRLLRPAGEGLASLMVSLVLVSVAITFANTMPDLGALALLHGPQYLAPFDEPQREALALLLIGLHRLGFTVNAVYWGLWLLPFGLLAMRSGFIPRWIGGWLIVNGVAYVIGSLTWLLAPAYGSMVFNYSMPALVGELWIMLWLLYKGFAPAKSQ
jgi:Domain of unknown function (DUF4386)